jgi:xylulokinase
MDYYLGLDIGTSGTKSLIMDAKARVLATATVEHPISAPRPGWSEQNPEDWWASAAKATGRVIKKADINGKDIKGIGLSGQMHGLVLLDAEGEVIRPSLLWNDQRTGKQASDIEQKVGGRKKLIKLTGNMAQTSFTLTKLLWVRENEPAHYDRAATMLLPKDYVRYRLTGQRVGEVSDMSGTLMLDPKTRDWSKSILQTFEIDSGLLPPVVESHEVTGRVTQDVAAKLGLAKGTIVVGGGGDQPAGAIGNGVVTDGLTSAMMGTSGVVFTHSKDFKTDPQSRVGTFCASVEGEYCMFGCVLSAGGSFQWLRNTIGAEEIRKAKREKCDPYELLTAQAAQAPIGCEGVFFLPYLTGERTPHADPDARGGWIGIHSRTRRNELIRSVMEGATFAMNDAVNVLKEVGQKITRIRLSGGGARSKFWRQMQADIYGKTCEMINTEEGGAYGVALLAGVGAGEFKNIKQACQAAIEVTQTIKPDPKARKAYARLHQQYDRLYPALKDEFKNINKL